MANVSACIAPNPVIAVYPSSDTIAENVLRFHIQFSMPMREGEVNRRIHLYDASGNKLSGVFFDHQYEFWSKDRTLLTLLVDPGRIKTGLRAHQDRGRAFQKDSTYTLLIAKGWPSISGTSSSNNHLQRFTIGSEDDEQPNIANWRPQVFRSTSLDSITIDFPAPIDYASAQSFIQIFSLANNHLLPGKIALSNQEKRWVFTPADTSIVGDYFIRVNNQLEDPAGNSLVQKFEYQSPSQQGDRYYPKGTVDLDLPITNY